MWGDGPKKAYIMLIGEAPGKDEDAQGKPFVGKAGRLLSSILEEFGVKRSDVYIANAVKCRPPQNRTPKKPEIQVCRKYLVEEIRAVDPRLIICMGGTSIRSITGDHRLTVGKARTSKYKYFNASVRTTFHPASVFRVPYNYKLITEDLSRFLGVSKASKSASADRQSLIRPSELKTYLQMFVRKGAVVLDIETSGLDPFAKDSKIWTVGFSCAEGESYVVPIFHKEGHNPDPQGSLDLISEYLLRNKNVRVIGHHIKFDLKWLMRFGAQVKCKVFDTMIAFHLLDENYPNKSLKHLAMVHTSMGDYAKDMVALRKKKEEYPDMQFPLEDMVKYNGNDCDATFRLYKVYALRLKEESLIRYMRFQMDVLKALLQMEINGMVVDQMRLNELVEEYTKKLKTVERNIRVDLGDINLDSPKQLAKALYEEKKYKVVKLTDGGSPSTDEEALAQLARYEKCKVAQNLIDRRKISKVLNTYLHGKAAQIKDDGKIHAEFRQASSREGEERGGTVTGRLSSDMQQIPKVGGIKSMFVSRFKGGLICQADYSQIELRVMAHFSRDPAMLDAFRRKDVDIHLSVASKVYRKPESEITKLERSHVKTINFGIIYCIGPKRLSDELECSERKAQKFMDEWFEAYPFVRSWIRQTEREVMDKGFVSTLFGRKRRLIGASRSDGVGREIIRQGVNSPIQGSAVDLTLFGMSLLHKKMLAEKLKSKLLLNVHDAIVADVHPSEVAFFEHEIPSIFENLPTKEAFDVELLVPLKIDVKFGKTWGDCEEYEKKVDKAAA